MQKISKYRTEIMGVAALWIFYYHVGELLLDGSRLTFLKNLEWYVRKTGYYGVDIFLFLSGMGLVWAIGKESLLRFYIRRFLRVYPAFFLYLTLSTLGRSDTLTLTDYLKRITFYANWAEDMLAFKWYVAAIMAFYLFFPAYYRILERRKDAVKFTLTMIAVLIAGLFIFHDSIREDLFLFLYRIPVFLLGILAGREQVKESKSGMQVAKEPSWKIVAGTLGAVWLFAISYLSNRGDWLGATGDSLVKYFSGGLIGILLCKALADFFDHFQEGRSLRLLRRGLRFVGALSLEFYLTHELFSLKVKSYHIFQLLVAPINIILETAACFVVSLAAAWALKKIVDSLFFIVRHFLARLDKSELPS